MRRNHWTIPAVVLAAALASGAAQAQDQSVAGVWQTHIHQELGPGSADDQSTTLTLTPDGRAELKGTTTKTTLGQDMPMDESGSGVYQSVSPGSFQVRISGATFRACQQGTGWCADAAGNPSAPHPNDIILNLALTDATHATDDHQHVWTKIQ